MSVGKLLDQVREYYLTRLEQAARNPDRGSVILEPALRDKHGAVAREGPFRLPLRQDLVLVSGGQVIEAVQVDTNSMLSFSAVSFGWGHRLRVTLLPFQWQFCPVAISPLGSNPDWTALFTWFERWFDANDTREPDSRGFHSVIHYLEEPSSHAGRGQFAVDFGTAPVEALEELLDAIEAMDCSEATLGAAV